jgi:hypothetical protein
VKKARRSRLTVPPSPAKLKASISFAGNSALLKREKPQGYEDFALRYKESQPDCCG